MEPAKTGAPADGRCRGCGADGLQRVLDLGELALDLCPDCALSQLAGEPGCNGPCQDCRPQDVTEAVRIVDAAELLRGERVRQFGGGHGGSWLPLLAQLGFTPVFGGTADVVVDSFAAVHDRDQRSAFRQLAAAATPDGVLLLHFDSLVELVRRGRWDFLAPRHFAYYSLTALVRLLAEVRMSVVATWRLDTPSGITTLLAAVPAEHWPAEPSVQRMLADEHQLKIATPEGFVGLQALADAQRPRP